MLLTVGYCYHRHSFIHIYIYTVITYIYVLYYKYMTHTCGKPSACWNSGISPEAR